jgi:transposase
VKIEWNLGLGVNTLGGQRQGTEWIARASGGDGAACPSCGSFSRSRKSRYRRKLQDLPMQGTAVTLSLELSRWRCRNLSCPRESFVEPLPGVASLHARRTHRVTELARLIGHSAGARPAEKILRQLGMPQSDDTVLRNLRKNAAVRPAKDLRVVGIDDWASLKGRHYGTVFVDLEKRIVIDVLSERSADATAKWLSHHPDIEVVSRDRCGLYAQGAARGAPKARQVADRFHLLDNLRLTIEQQLSREQRGVDSNRPSRDPITPATMADYQGHGRQAELLHHRRLASSGRRVQWQAKFDRLKELQAAGHSVSAIKRETGLHWKTITKWLPLDTLPERRAMEPRATTPRRFADYLAKRWAEGHKSARHLLPELKARGYDGSQTHLQRLLGQWRRADHAGFLRDLARDNTAANRSPGPLPLAPIPAASLCIKPTKLLTEQQSARITQLKQASPSFTTMRRLAMRFRGILRGNDPERLDDWMNEAHSSGLYGIRRFVLTLRNDMAAVRNAIAERWSNGQVEGQINRLKTVKRSMYGHANTDLLRARMLPLDLPTV